MLPITTQRSFHVPHTLAVAAALMAMIAAIGWNSSASRSLTDRHAQPAIHAVVDSGTRHDPEREHSAASTANGDGPCSTDSGCLRSQGLFHLVLPGLPSR